MLTCGVDRKRIEQTIPAGLNLLIVGFGGVLKSTGHRFPVFDLLAARLAARDVPAKPSIVGEAPCHKHGLFCCQAITHIDFRSHGFIIALESFRVARFRMA